MPDEASSSYNALLVKLEKRLSAGLTFLLAYTYSKLLDNGSGTQTFLEPATGHQTASNRRIDYAPSDQDVSQRFVYSFTYALPFGKGKSFGGNWSPAGQRNPGRLADDGSPDVPERHSAFVH